MTTEEKTLKCGLIMPISAIDDCNEAHWDEVRLIIKEALKDTLFRVELVSDSNEIGIIQKRIVQNIYDNDIVICDVSAKNPNVMFELGMRLSFDRPAIIIKDDKTNYSFDTSPIEHLEYPRDLHYHSIQNFKNKLKEKVNATFNASKLPEYTTFLKHFGSFVVANIDQKKVGKDDYIISVINDLKSEIMSMSRYISSISSSSGTRVVDAELMTGKPYGLDGRTYINEYEYIKNLIKNGYIFPPKDVLLDKNSIEFRKLLDRYLDLHVPRNISIKNRHNITISSNLVKAIEECIQ